MSLFKIRIFNSILTTPKKKPFGSSAQDLYAVSASLLASHQKNSHHSKSAAQIEKEMRETRMAIEERKKADESLF
jgi:hypothetical protein